MKNIVFSNYPADIKTRQARDAYQASHSNVLNQTFDSYHVQYLGLSDQDGWEHDLFTVGINGSLFEFRTGLGHRSKRGNQRHNTIVVHAPKLDDVLHSLILDSVYSDQSFANFCADLGYDTDSRRALDLYLLCQKNTAKIVPHLAKPLDQAFDLFSEY